jgi:NitT/TauT family transport system substrate-binding protein
VKPVVHLIADAGFANYNTTINISKKMVDEKLRRRAALRHRLAGGLGGVHEGRAADRRGQQADQARQPGHGSTKKIDYAVKVMTERGIVMSGDAPRSASAP